jgi:hypothetical protein
VTDPFAPPPARDDTVIRQPGRIPTLIVTVVVVAVALLLLNQAGFAPRGAVIGLVVGVLSVLRTRVELTPTELVNRRGLFTQRYRWSDIIRIEPRRLMGSENASITLTTGRRVTLVAPRRGLTTASRQQYNVDVARLVAYWQAARGQVPPPH